MRSTFFVALLLGYAFAAEAQEAATDSELPGIAQPDSSASLSVEISIDLPSPQRAMILSALNTTVPVFLSITFSEEFILSASLATYGVLIGPSIGHLYGETERRGRGILERITILGVGAGSFYLIAPHTDGYGALVAALVGTTFIIVGSAIGDILTAPGATRRANERRLEERASVSLLPTALRVSGATQTGLRLALRF